MGHLEKIAGLVLDVYDDRDGAVLRSIYPNREQVPQLVKEAHRIDPEEGSFIPDDLYALVITQGDRKLRKFACVDPGNTELAVQYFLRTGGKLSPEAQKQAAANLLTACSWYDMEPPEVLEKVALGGLIMPAISGALTVPGALRETKAQLAVNKGPVVLTPAQRKANMQQAGFAG